MSDFDQFAKNVIARVHAAVVGLKIVGNDTAEPPDLTEQELAFEAYRPLPANPGAAPTSEG